MTTTEIVKLGRYSRARGYKDVLQEAFIPDTDFKLLDFRKAKKIVRRKSQVPPQTVQGGWKLVNSISKQILKLKPGAPVSLSLTFKRAPDGSVSDLAIDHALSTIAANRKAALKTLL